MEPSHLRRNSIVLLGMLALASVYLGWLEFQGTFTGPIRLDGLLGVMLGLYICSHPAANTLDMLLFMRPDARERIVSLRAGQIWLALNALTFLVGWLVIFAGIMRLVVREI